jgi:hypothetical protein
MIMIDEWWLMIDDRLLIVDCWLLIVDDDDDEDDSVFVWELGIPKRQHTWWCFCADIPSHVVVVR